jgi:hypothetical protein
MNMFRVHTRRLTAAAALMSVLAFTGTALAKDAVQAGVTIPAGEPIPVITENGSGYTPGTYATGTIQLNYVYVGTTFPQGPFARFNLGLNVYDTASVKNEPAYPVALDVEQIGGGNVSLVPGTSPVFVSGLGWTAVVPVDISIPDDIATSADWDDDGDQLVGILRLVTPGGSQLDTVTNVLVKITLVHPSAACLKAYNFITDAALTNTTTSTEVNVNKQGKVTSTNPYGSLSDNVLVANTCAGAESFDLKIGLDSWFTTQPSNNPGNAVFTFSTAGEIDPTTFNIGSFGTGTAQGQKLCLGSVSVPAGATFLATVHVAINNNQLASGLPAGGTFNGFVASLFGAATACSGALNPMANPNPVSAPLAFTIK